MVFNFEFLVGSMLGLPLCLGIFCLMLFHIILLLHAAKVLQNFPASCMLGLLTEFNELCVDAHAGIATTLLYLGVYANTLLLS